jgi:membrane protease YdiL (CAAX protease family)
MPPAWYPDPWYPGAIRWWDGRAWTGYATVPSAGTSPAPFATLPFFAAVVGLVITGAALVGGRFALDALGHLRWPVVVYAVLAAVIGYGPMLAYCVYASRRWGSGNLVDDVGLRARWADVGWGPLIWVTAWVAGIVAAIVALAFRIPLKSNTDSIHDLQGDRGVLIAFLVVAVVVAPVVEELVFRGVVLRGFAAVLPVWWAVVLEGLCFGAAHVDPVRGVGNLGLVLVLAAVGAVFGGAAYLLRRIGPTIIAHALYNGVVLAIVLLSRP